MTTSKERFQLAFTVFAMFFGAGNLIFPVFLAYKAGGNIIPAFTGFALTAIGCPMLALIAVGKGNSLESIGNRIHPLFSRIFTIIIYLAIGPCLAIPRTSSTSFEMVAAATGNASTFFSIVYSFIFFAIAGIIAIHPEKLTKTLGRILAPILLLLILGLFLGTIKANATMNITAEEYAASPFAKGFTEGYQTMDAIAGLVFGTVLALNLEDMGKRGKEEKKEGKIAAIGGGIILLIVYSILALIGTKANIFAPDATNGADILSGAAAFISSDYGRILIAVIFVIACFNTSVGLLSSCGEYFTRIYPRLSRTGWIAVFALVSAVIANVGLETIISLSGPVLEFIYPAAIILTIITIIPGSENMHIAYICGTTAALASSLLPILGVPLPLSASGFGWLIPSVVFTVLGIIIDKKKAA